MRKNYVFFAVIIVIAIMLVSVFSACNSNAQDGKSAYEIAVENGFVGTEQEWLQSLVGAQGQDGSNGTNGQNGQDVSIEDIYDSAVKNGYQGTFLEFLKEYLSMNIDEDVAGINTALLSAVTIVCDFEVTQQSYVPGQGVVENTYTATSAGSGVIYSLDKENGNAYIITNQHVVYYAQSNNTNGISDNIRVLLYGKEYSDYIINASYVGGSSTYDIAVLKIENSEILKNSDARAVSIAQYNSVEVGSTVVAIGNAAGEGLSVTQGILSVDSEVITIENDDGSENSYRVMRVDAAINSGNSGGGLFDKNGQLIGIVNAKVNSTTIENIGYAIPISIAIGVADNIIDNCDGQDNITMSKYSVGIAVSINQSNAVYDGNTMTTKIVEEVKVSEVQETSALAGQLQEGDIIKSISINSQKIEVTRTFHVIDAILAVRVGDKIEFEIQRGEENLTIAIESASADNFISVV